MTTPGNTLSPTQTKQASIWTTGFALFTMFFGAGNLIFPLIIGQTAGKNIWYSILGLGMTAVFVPFLGLAAMILFNANIRDFFSKIGKIPGFLIFLTLQLIVGPFGVIPRLMVLMHAIAKPYIFNTPLMLFSTCVAILIFLASRNRNRIVPLLGSVFTPVLIISLTGLILIGLYKQGAHCPNPPLPSEAFFKGFIGGYNTMDLIAAFLFSTVVLPYFQKSSMTSSEERQKDLFKKMFLSSAIAAFLLLTTYIGLSLVSASHGYMLVDQCLPEELLSKIAMKLLGPFGGAIAAVAVITACLTTALTLAAIFSDFVSVDITKNKLSKTTSLIMTLVIAAIFANLGFKGISSFLVPILTMIYPSLIILSITNIIFKVTGYKFIKIPVLITFAISVFNYLFK